jgi:hypothetical protein
MIERKEGGGHKLPVTRLSSQSHVIIHAYTLMIFHKLELDELMSVMQCQFT